MNLREKKVIAFNGPPGSGKDTLADSIVANYADALKFTLVTPALELLLQLHNIDLDHYLQHKETYRPLLIKLSNGIKKIYTESTAEPECSLYVNLLARKALTTNCRFVVVSDLGFDGEYQALEDLIPESLLLIRVHREGHNFLNDSRNYVYPDHAACTLDFFNCGSNKSLRKINNVVLEWMQQ